MGFAKSSDPCLRPLSVSHDSQHMVGASKPRWKKGWLDTVEAQCMGLRHPREWVANRLSKSPSRCQEALGGREQAMGKREWSGLSWFQQDSRDAQNCITHIILHSQIWYPEKVRINNQRSKKKSQDWTLHIPNVHPIPFCMLCLWERRGCRIFNISPSCNHEHFEMCFLWGRRSKGHI